MLGSDEEFYRCSLVGNSIRYGAQVNAMNKSFMKIIYKKGGLLTNLINHSGKWMCASQLYSQLYSAGMDEQAIMKRTGHISERAVRKYK